MKYFFIFLVYGVAAIAMLTRCSGGEDQKPVPTYSASSPHVTVTGKSKTDEATAKAAGALNQMVLDSMENP